MPTRLTEHFALEELLPPGLTAENVPEFERGNLERLCIDILEPVRVRFGLAVVIHSGWRPRAINAVTVGSAKESDHMAGRAADFHVAAGNGKSWELNTTEARDFVAVALRGKWGQLILEDHRKHYENPGKFWLHAAIVSEKHRGDGNDLNGELFSLAPGQYEPWKGQA